MGNFISNVAGNQIMKINKWLYLILIIIIAATVILPGCKNYQTIEGNGYKTFIMNRGVAKFSFDFSTKYEITGVNVNSTYTTISLSGPDLDQTGNSTVIFISIVKSPYLNYQSSLDDQISLYKHFTDFNLLEKYSVTISDEQAEELVYYYLQPLGNESIAKGTKPVHKTTRHLEFMHDSLIWALDIASLESSVEEDKIDFEQIKKTFKILD
jgi:hypothetical protein